MLEIGHFVAAPFAARVLADLGADIIKIEPPQGDPARQWGEQIDGNSLWWSVHGRNKRSITLNLKHSRARDLVLALVAALQTPWSRTSIDRASLPNCRPRPEGSSQRRALDLIVAHISGYGQTGPYRDRAAFGVIGEAIGGLRHLSDHAPGASDLPPVRVGVSIGDSIAGLYAALGVIAALWQHAIARRR